jgi:hypothetical protein
LEKARLLKQRARLSDEMYVSKHRGSAAVAAVFLSTAAAVLSVGLFGGAAVGFYINRYLSDSISRSAITGAAVALSGVLVASLLAFFGSVLKLLTEIAEQNRGQLPLLNGALRAAGAPGRAGPAVARSSLNKAVAGASRASPVPPAAPKIPDELRDDLGAWLSW